jgi:hypothetical protein
MPFPLALSHFVSSSHFSRFLLYCSSLSSETVFVNLLWSPGIDPSLAGRDRNPICRTGPPDYIAWRSLFLGIDAWAPPTFTNTGSGILNLSKWRLTPRQWGRGGEIFLRLHQNFSINCWHFPSKARGAVFHQISEDFHPSALSEYFLNVYDVKKHTVSQKNKS